MILTLTAALAQTIPAGADVPDALRLQMTPQGLRRLGSREFDSESGRMPGLFAPVAVMAATGNPIGLIVGGGANVAGEATGKETLEGAAKRTAAEAGKEFRAIFQRQGWI